MAKAGLIADDYEKLSNKEIVDKMLENGLIQKCVDMQFLKLPKSDYWKMEYKNDFFQDLVVWLLTYDNAKLNNAFHNHHENALITRIIQNQIYSNHSEFYLRYLRLQRRSIEIDRKVEDRYFGTKEDE